MLHEPLHAAPHLQRHGVRIQVLFRMLQEKLVLDVFQPLRPREQRDLATRRPGTRHIAGVGHHIRGFVLRHLVEAIIEIVGDGVAGPARLFPPLPTDEHQRRIALRVEVHDQDALPGPGRGRVREHDSDGRFADAALPVRHCKELRHSHPSSCPGRPRRYVILQ